MSTTLTWASSGAGVKTGTAIANFFDDLDTLITSKAADGTFSWQKAGKNSAATPYWLLLSRKDGSAGRILIVAWTSTPAANNVAILDTNPSTTLIYIAYFPAGTANTASNLTAASGAIVTVDTGAVKVSPLSGVATSYPVNFVPFYFDCYDGVMFGFANPGSTTTYMMGAGSLIVDSTDTAYDCTIGFASSSASTWGSTSAQLAWTGTALQAGSSSATVRTNYGTANRVYFQAWATAGIWASQAVGSADVLTDTSNSKAWFVPIQLLGQTKGEGFVLKMRQIGFGPGTTGPLTAYNTTGPVVAARQFNITTAGGAGFPWFTNFKI